MESDWCKYRARITNMLRFLHSLCIHWSKQTVWNVYIMSSAMKNATTFEWLERSVKPLCRLSQIIRTLLRMSQTCCWSTRSVSARRRWRTCSTQPHRRYVKHFELPLFIKFAIQIHLRRHSWDAVYPHHTLLWVILIYHFRHAVNISSAALGLYM